MSSTSASIRSNCVAAIARKSWRSPAVTSMGHESPSVSTPSPPSINLTESPRGVMLTGMPNSGIPMGPLSTSSRSAVTVISAHGGAPPFVTVTV